jgi:arylsulfate sulfotransferase
MALRQTFATLAALLLIGCGDSTPLHFTTAPSIVANPNPAVPLAAIVSAATDEPAELVIEVSDGDRKWNVPESGELATEHHRAVLGFKAGRKHQLRVSARDQAGNVSDVQELEFETAALPSDFPPMKTVVSAAEKMEPGVTLFALMKWPTGAPLDEDYGLALAVDATGEVVWYYRGDEAVEDPRPLPNGNLLCIIGHNRAFEIDMLGNVVAQWHASQHPNPRAVAKVPEGSIPVETETFHHEIQQMPSGNLLVLSTEMRRIEDYPADPGKPGGGAKAANVIGDVVVEFARDGSIVHQWKLMDMLDVYRVGYDSHSPTWNNWAYTQVSGGTLDWAHGNSLFYDESDDSILVSFRNQDAVVKFSRETGKLIWIMGTHDGWKAPWKPYLLEPQGGLAWQYHEHAARMTPGGNLLLFDNGNYRHWPPGEKQKAQDSYSRVVEYAIDAKARTVREVWKYGGPGDETFFSPFISEADLLPRTGNVLVTDGGRIRDKEGNTSDDIRGGHHWARIAEVTHTSPPQKVFELVIDNPDKDNTLGWAVYRSERLASLYTASPTKKLEAADRH